MSFYVTLPSNASLDRYPDNTQSNYTTALNKTLLLNQNYQVALSELNYNSDISINLGTLCIEDCFKEYYFILFFDAFDPLPLIGKPLQVNEQHSINRIEIELKFINGVSAQNLIKTLNNTIKTALLKYDYKNRYFLAFFKTSDAILNKIRIRNENEQGEPIFDVYECYKTLEDNNEIIEYRILDTKDSRHASTFVSKGGIYGKTLKSGFLRILPSFLPTTLGDNAIF